MPKEKIRQIINFLYRLFHCIPLNVPLMLMQLIGSYLGFQPKPEPPEKIRRHQPRLKIINLGYWLTLKAIGLL